MCLLYHSCRARRQPWYNFYVTHSDWPTKCICCILCRVNVIAVKISKQTWAQTDRLLHIPSYIMASTSKYNGFCLGTCECTDCRPWCAQYSHYDLALLSTLRSSSLLVIADLGMLQHIHVIARTLVDRAQNGHECLIRYMWRELITINIKEEVCVAITAVCLN